MAPHHDATPRYAFVTLEPGQTKREVFLSLSLYGDVRLMSKISEVSALVTDLVKNLETVVAAEQYISPVVETLPSTRPVRMNKRCLPTDAHFHQITKSSSHGKRKADDDHVPEPLPRAPPSSISSSSSSMLALPAFASSPVDEEISLSHMEQLQQNLDESQEMLAMFKSEDDSINFESDLGVSNHEGDYDSDEFIDSKDGIIERQYEEPDEIEEPCTSARPSFPMDEDLEMTDDIQSFMDDEGNIEVPYKLNIQECKPSRKEVVVGKQAQCEVCRRWVRTTDTLSRLIAHVFMHAQKQRFVCPVDGCEYSNKSEPNTRRHISAAHDANMDPVDIQNDKKKSSESWKIDRCKWAPRCFPEHFETAPGGNIFMRVNEKTVLMNDL